MGMVAKPAAKTCRRLTYRLYPTATQHQLLLDTLELHRTLYNAALQERRDAWKRHRKSISYFDQCKSLTTIRADCPEYKALNCQSARSTLKRLDLAFGSFFRRVKVGNTPGYPRFRGKSQYRGFGYQTHGDGYRFTSDANYKHGKLRLAGIGTLSARGNARTLPTKIVSADIRRDSTGWLLSLCVECAPTRTRTRSKETGLDWGVETYATLAYAPGQYDRHDNDRIGQQCSAAIIDAQRQLAKSRSYSRKAKNARTILARRAQKAANKRKDRAHKLSARLVKEHRLIVTEQLDIKSMTRQGDSSRSCSLNREVLDTTPALLLQFLAYKAAEAGTKLVVLDTRKYKPSQTCPICRYQRKKALSERCHKCQCGFTASRDQAAALNMLAIGLALEGREPAWIRPRSFAA